MSDFLKRHYAGIWWSVLFIIWLPAALLAQGYFTHDLGTNGLETLERTTGRWAFIWLVVTLLITPLRWALTLAARSLSWSWGKRLPDWNILMRLRRMIGMSCFGYAVLHALVYLEFDLGYQWDFLADDLGQKPYILVGFANLLLLALLAVTSFDVMVRRLKQNWRRIHRLVYLVGILAVAHWWWMSKPGDLRALPYIVIMFSLLAWRIPHLLGWLKLPDDDGMETRERPVV